MNYEHYSMTKKYILKPGRHQFAPGSHAVHNNDNLSDEEAEWYLERYPHITRLFVRRPSEGGALNNKRGKTSDEELQNEMQHIDQIDGLTPPLGGKGDI